MNKIAIGALALALVCQSGYKAAAQSIKLSLQANKTVAEVQPTMWGIFFEDINFAADGGLYAELVKNRSFEFSNPLMGWKELKNENTSGKILIENLVYEHINNPRYAHITVDANSGSYGLSNEGFRGMGVKEGEQYDFSILVRNSENSPVKIIIQLISADGKIIGESSVENFTKDWNKYSSSFICKQTDAKAHLNVLFQGKGSVDIDMVSLFPHHTWKNRPNGLRADLVQLLYDLKPGFIRFPGGCIVEGRDLANRYQWKNTVGKVEDRKLIINRWNTEFSYRSTPDYFQSYGLGFYEYFQLAEDIGAEPLPIINCGMACQFNTSEVVPVNQLDQYIQDMLDLIEFANGNVSTKWGKLRADMGHPAPFNLKMLGVGNEQWDEQYIERYKVIEKILKEKYPNIKLVASSGPSPDGDRFDYLWKQHKALNTDLVDEHYYQSPEWFYKNVSRYDNYDRKGPKVFAGEYASHTKGGAAPESRNNWEAALSEAALMTGLERNAAVVNMASYAPLFAHVDAWQWNPNLIWFDNLHSFGTPNYYVQKAFANNKGTNVVPILIDNQIVEGKDSLYASSVIDKKSGELIVKLVNAGSADKSVEINVAGAKLNAKSATCEVLHSDNFSDYNTFDTPVKISPKPVNVKISGKNISFKIGNHSFYVIKVNYKE
jgi:alpha-L-arabinofuranosidase